MSNLDDAIQNFDFFHLLFNILYRNRIRWFRIVDMYIESSIWT